MSIFLNDQDCKWSIAEPSTNTYIITLTHSPTGKSLQSSPLFYQGHEFEQDIVCKLAKMDLVKRMGALLRAATE